MLAGGAVSRQRAIKHGKSIIFYDKTILCFLRGGASRAEDAADNELRQAKEWFASNKNCC